MQRRTFLELLGAAPLAALVPWRPPAPRSRVVVGVDYGSSDESFVVLSAITPDGRVYVTGRIRAIEVLTRVEFTGDAAVLYVAERDSGVPTIWRRVMELRDVCAGPVIVNKYGRDALRGEVVVNVERPFTLKGLTIVGVRDGPTWHTVALTS